jgi:hypothetical protein
MLFLFNSLRGAFGTNTARQIFQTLWVAQIPQRFEPNSNKGMSREQKIEVLKKIFVLGFYLIS